MGVTHLFYRCCSSTSLFSEVCIYPYPQNVLEGKFCVLQASEKNQSFSPAFKGGS